MSAGDSHQRQSCGTSSICKTQSKCRPHFNSNITSDRLATSNITMSSKLAKNRRSVFIETGLDERECDSSADTAPSSASSGPCSMDEIRELPSEHETVPQRQRASTYTTNSTHRQSDLYDVEEERDDENEVIRDQRRDSAPVRRWYDKITRTVGHTRLRSLSGSSSAARTGLSQFTMVVVLIAVMLPTLSYREGRIFMGISGANAGPIVKRETSPTDVCKRWAHQVALLNSTLYIYGGQANVSEGHDSETWNNYILTLDLTEDWDTSSPALKGLDVPDGPPPVAMGALWRDYDNLYLYGGQFSSEPYVDPEPESMWQYSIRDSVWTEFVEPRTSDGNESAPGGELVHRAAEGATISVPELGLSWYFGGHLDWATTPGWSRQIDRVYLKSLLEFTHPGYVNSGVDELSDGVGAGEEGAFRNITEGGVQAGVFPERADGTLIFVPGWGKMGVLIGLAGGQAETFTEDLSVLDVYDIESSQWFHQETSGDTPSVRVNPCAVIASAPDASSFQIYLFGGQNLPFGEQTQYNDMYILSIPAFVWIKVPESDDAPSPRAGHSCTMQDGQVILVGGTSSELTCDSSGVYVFDASSLSWTDSFSAGDHDDDYETGNMVRAGSYGYRVPELVQDAIGGDEEGGATASTPAAGPATDGPFATGTAPVFTITQPGATATVIHNGPTGTAAPEDTPEGDDSNSSDTIDPGLIVAAVVAGLAGALALYLGFCAWLYRRQVSAYKRHLAVVNRYPAASFGSLDPGVAWFGGARRTKSKREAATSDEHYSGDDENSGLDGAAAAAVAGRRGRRRDSQDSFGWVGSADMSEPHWLAEPKWLSDEPSPSTATGSGSGNGSGYLSAPQQQHSSLFEAHQHQQQALREQREQQQRQRAGRRPRTSGSDNSSDALLGDQEPSFFSVVLGPRRALRVVNGID